ncbi:hypothetical protein CIT26_01625 [Mesorhizobium temperatum]|uniref:Uncharacterized protein n=2 Tax=Mesorhizobium temperatum TaxID=241416 RepID=A0A271LX57_9HYPH|nr:hypothetical protein CIT26_01625 [Mesorhizobium temperatum]
MRLELAEAASFLGIYDGGRYHRSGYAIDWQMIEITSVERKGFQLFLAGQLIEMADGPVVHFSITCPDEIITVGDVVSGSYSAISVFHPAKCEPRSYKATWFENERFLRVIPTGEHALRPLREPHTLIEAGSERVTPASVLIRRSRTHRARSVTKAPPPPKKKSKAKSHPNRKAIRTIPPAKQNAEPKPKSAGQMKRDEMISKVVVEYRRDRRSRLPKDKK